MNQREEQREKRRQDILEAALELFVCKGYSATRTGDIAKAVRMSDGLLFHYFPTKESLYGELIRTGMEVSGTWLQAAPEAPLAYFTHVAEEVLSLLREDPRRAGYFVLMARAQRSSETPAPVRALLGAQEARLAETLALIEAGQALGELRAGDPAALAYAFWCSLQGIAEQLAAHPDTPFPQAEWIVSILKPC